MSVEYRCEGDGMTYGVCNNDISSECNSIY